jgi:hypothetical protein
MNTNHKHEGLSELVGKGGAWGVSDLSTALHDVIFEMTCIWDITRDDKKTNKTVYNRGQKSKKEENIGLNTDDHQFDTPSDFPKVWVLWYEQIIMSLL